MSVSLNKYIAILGRVTHRAGPAVHPCLPLELGERPARDTVRVSCGRSRHGPFKGSAQRLLVLPLYSGLDQGHRQKRTSLFLCTHSLVLEKGALIQRLWAGHGELPCDPKAYRLQVLFGFRQDPSWLLTVSVTWCLLFHLSDTLFPHL